MSLRRTLCVSSRAELRLAFAGAFARQLPAREPALLLLPSHAAGTQLMARVLRPGEARFGWRRRTLDALARELALPELARDGRVPLSGLAVEALVSRVVHELGRSHALGRYAELAERPGFVRALAKTIDELRLARIEPEVLVPHAPELASVLDGYRQALHAQLLADRTHVLDAAQRALEQRPSADIPLLALDVPLLHPAEARLAAALCAGRSEVALTAIGGDERSEVHWHEALGPSARVLRQEPTLAHEADDLVRLQVGLFAPGAHARAGSGAVRVATPITNDSAVRIVSSPGEAREAVEVARGLAEAAARGVAFDRMAVVLRAAESYRAVVEEALLRADIPAHFADGVRRPLPEGRALLALLACARDDLSASAFAEYLSLGAMPRAQGEDPPATPRQWERMLVEAAVIGGRERWTRRIAGLRRALEDERAALEADDPRAAQLLGDSDSLQALAQFAAPILDLLASLPEGGTWGAWIAALGRLARHCLHAPEHVLAVLAELAPLSPIGPVELASVHRVLSQRLSSVVQPSAGHGAGKVFVGAIEDVRGRAFERVFVTGLAERVFPQRISEDTLLPDQTRRALGTALWLTEERVARERLLLRIAVGAATQQLVLSFPRFDLAHGRPRVPSFYGLEVLQAIDGTLPAYDELTRRAQPGAAARMGFPAPERAEQAIDDAEYDLAMLDRLMRAPAGGPTQKGAARYLLSANVHLARALRFRARRWEFPKFSAADGFVATSDAGRALLSAHRLAARPYSATALAQFAVCPYRFYLHAIVGLAERPEVSAVDELDARQRGVLFHRVQRAVFSALRDARQLPLTEASLPAAQRELEARFEALSAQARDDYAPSIEGVFDTGLRSILRDLREWLARELHEKAFVPTHFELGFGVSRGLELDDTTRREPVRLPGGAQLRGSIDLVEELQLRGDEAHKVLRATDYKTSLKPDKLGLTTQGRVLQPLLYALALEQLFPGAQVASGRLYFCTARGEYKSHEVPLDGAGRAIIKELLGCIDTMIERGFLPAAPALQPEDRERSECERCAYKAICGPYEGERVGMVKSAKEWERLGPLLHVRGLQ